MRPIAACGAVRAGGAATKNRTPRPGRADTDQSPIPAIPLQFEPPGANRARRRFAFSAPIIASLRGHQNHENAIRPAAGIPLHRHGALGAGERRATAFDHGDGKAAHAVSVAAGMDAALGDQHRAAPAPHPRRQRQLQRHARRHRAVPRPVRLARERAGRRHGDRQRLLQQHGRAAALPAADLAGEHRGHPRHRAGELRHRDHRRHRRGGLDHAGVRGVGPGGAARQRQPRRTVGGRGLRRERPALGGQPAPPPVRGREPRARRRPQLRRRHHPPERVQPHVGGGRLRTEARRARAQRRLSPQRHRQDRHAGPADGRHLLRRQHRPPGLFRPRRRHRLEGEALRHRHRSPHEQLRDAAGDAGPLALHRRRGR